MGAYASDAVPQLTNYSFAIIISAPSNDRGEHWNMVPRLEKTTTVLILWEERDQLTPFLIKNFRHKVLRKLQKTDKLCGFYAI